MSDLYSNSTSSTPINIYEEDINENTALNLSCRDLNEFPEIDLKSDWLCAIYLENNNLTTLPEDFFSSFPNLMYLDLRQNRLTDLPKNIQNHACLTHLLLQNNCLTSLPDELGTVCNLKVLQLNGNPLMYPPREVIKEGTAAVVKFLHDKYVDSIFVAPSSHDNVSVRSSELGLVDEKMSYNSVLHSAWRKPDMAVKFNEKGSDDDVNERGNEKCPRLERSKRRVIPSYYQSARYLKPLYADDCMSTEEKVKENFKKDMIMAKHKQMVAKRERILQERKNTEQMRSWRQRYRYTAGFRDPRVKLDPATFPYDTSPEYMTFLSREDIEKDLPDKFRKHLYRRSKPTAPRQGAANVHLAMRIKQLFQNLEDMDTTRQRLTPRSEQQALLNEIQKISEIKKKLNELSITNQQAV